VWIISLRNKSSKRSTTLVPGRIQEKHPNGKANILSLKHQLTPTNLSGRNNSYPPSNHRENARTETSTSARVIHNPQNSARTLLSLSRYFSDELMAN
jgi:hypothetical protein